MVGCLNIEKNRRLGAPVSRQEANIRRIIVITTPLPSSGLIKTNIRGRGLARSVLVILVQCALRRSTIQHLILSSQLSNKILHPCNVDHPWLYFIRFCLHESEYDTQMILAKLYCWVDQDNNLLKYRPLLRLRIS